MSNYLEVETTGDTLVVRFTRPEIRNPLSVVVLGEMNEVIDGLGNFAALIFTGVGDVFASGADLREIAGVDAEGAREFAERGQLLLQRLSGIPQMTIAAVNGYCFGGALDLALACDKRVAAHGAKFAHPGSGLGIITGWGGTQRLPRLVGTANALEMFFTAAPIDSERALSVGLIDEIAADPLNRSLILAEAQGEI